MKALVHFLLLIWLLYIKNNILLLFFCYVFYYSLPYNMIYCNFFDCYGCIYFYSNTFINNCLFLFNFFEWNSYINVFFFKFFNFRLFNIMVLYHPLLLYTYLYFFFFLKISKYSVFSKNKFIPAYYKNTNYILISAAFSMVWSSQELFWNGFWNWDFVEISLINFLILSLLWSHNYKNNFIVYYFLFCVVLFLFFLTNKTNLITSQHSFSSSFFFKISKYYYYFVFLYFFVKLFFNKKIYLHSYYTYYYYIIIYSVLYCIFLKNFFLNFQINSNIVVLINCFFLYSAIGSVSIIFLFANSLSFFLIYVFSAFYYKPSPNNWLYKCAHFIFFYFFCLVIFFKLSYTLEYYTYSNTHFFKIFFINFYSVFDNYFSIYFNSNLVPFFNVFFSKNYTFFFFNFSVYSYLYIYSFGLLI